MNIREIPKGSEFYLDETLDGVAMREQMIRFYNMLAYWSNAASIHDAKKKQLSNLLDQLKDRAKCVQAEKCNQKGVKSVIQDAMVRNIWDVEIEIDGEIYTPKAVQTELSEVIAQDNEARGNVSICQTAVDICRSALSWDKQELGKMV